MSIRLFRWCAAWTLVISLFISLLFSASACRKDSNPVNPVQPSQPSPAVDTSGTPSVTVPKLILPAVEAVVRNIDQPVTFVIGNAVVTRGSATTYTFEVASDPGFSSKVFTKTAVGEGSGGQTAVTIDRLGAGSDYYWRARGEAGGTTGPFTGGRRLTIGPALVLNPPTPISPLNGTISNGWPSFTVNNSFRAGPVGQIVYRFEIAVDAAFSSIVLVATITETSNRTTYVPPASQPAPVQTTLFWRATALDTANGISSVVSAVQSFTFASPTPQSRIAAQLGVPLWPGIQPSGTTGHATLGGGWDVMTIRSFDGVTFVSPPLEELQIFDLLDRGYDPGSAISWMKSNGYPTTAAYYPFNSVIGFPFQYMALINGVWDLVTRVGG